MHIYYSLEDLSEDFPDLGIGELSALLFTGLDELRKWLFT